MGKFPGVQLVIVGDGDLREELQEYARSLKIDSCTHFLGFREDVLSIMMDFNLFVHPSRWEGFGLVFLEAMTVGVPIIGTNVGAIQEIIDDGRTGILVKVDDSDALAQAICQLLSPPGISE